MESNRSGNTAQVAGLELEQHECLHWRVVITTNPEVRCRLEAEARIIKRITEDHDRAESELTAVPQAGAHERGTDTVALMRQGDRHRRKAHEAQFRVPIQRHGREHDVANYFAILFRDEGDNRMCLFPEGVNEIGFRRSPEGRSVHCPDGRSILLLFGSNVHALGLGLKRPRRYAQRWSASVGLHRGTRRRVCQSSNQAPCSRSSIVRHMGRA